MIGRWHGLVIDCPDPRALAEFYEKLLGMIRVQDDPGWVVIGDAPDRPGVAFARVESWQPPRWPRESAHMHFDVRVDDLTAAGEKVLELGARKLDDSDKFHVYADPAGHPFCLVSL
ncbi:VOC family protein [Lentzea sp. BCCO 10_0856]|uniref:VOC family protein n=1 Tax=Lentzea miocenica TaxID=3095431 RepID=A0ABU4T7C7_9PSEU|nr:VOC family protein [Lentzea sp. BCCO 10_0856]MDX8034071.1 VOC family protein [Lentzea sp. BCCO 10_0856]